MMTEHTIDIVYTVGSLALAYLLKIIPILSRSRICGLKGWQGMANSNTSPILACANSTVSGGSYAQVHYHPDTRPSLPLRQRLLPAAPGLPGQRQSHGHDPLDGPLRCRGADLLDLRDLPPPDRRPQRGDLRQGPLRPALLPRSTQTQGQRRLRRPPAQGPAPPQATTPRRHRSDLDPLLWPTPAWPPRDLPLQGQRGYPLVLRLRHRLGDAPRPVVHLGRDPGDPLRDAQGRAPRTAGSGQQSRAPTRLVAPGPRLLQRGDHSLPAAGPAAVPDAGDLPWPQGRPSPRTQRVELVQADEAEWLVHPHAPKRQEKESHRRDLREAHPVDGSTWADEVGHLGVCLLGDHSPARGLGQADLSEAVRDRDRLPADEPVPDSDDDQEVQRAVPLRGDRTVV